MKFWEWFKNLYPANGENAQESQNESAFSYPDVIVELEVAGRQYILVELKINICQDASKVKANEEYPYPGMIMVEMRGIPDSLCMNWAVSSLRRYDGSLYFYSCKDCLKEGMKYSIAFTEARCVSLQRNRKGAMESTCMYISPRSILIGGERWNNQWK